MTLSIRPKFFRWAAAAAFCFSFATALLAAEARIAFDVPLGEARDTLKKFAQQAGREIVFSPVGAIQTKAVKGQFTVREALDRLLAGTDLTAFEDAKTGGMVVRRDDDPNAPRAAPENTGRRPNAPKAAEAKTGAATAQAVELARFVVSADSQVGYLATQTLSGTRLATSLKDVGASIDVLTEEFLNDVGATNMLEALQYSANAGNFNGTSDNDFVNNAQISSTTFFVRGFTSSSVGLDFFSNGIVPLDRYNSESLTLVRGANSILYGVGSPGGSISAASKTSRLDRNRYAVKFVGNDYGSLRTEMDLDQVLRPKRLGLRIAALRGRTKTYQRPYYYDRDGFYGSLTYKPGTKTSITLNAETGSYNRPFLIPYVVGDAYTPWVQAGRPLWNWKTPLANGTLPSSPQAAALNTAPGSGLARLNAGSNYFLAIAGQPNALQNWRGAALGESASLPGNIDNTAIAQRSFTSENAIVPPSTNADGNTNWIRTIYNRQTVSVQQQLAPGLSLEAAWNRMYSRYYYNSTMAQGQLILRADPNLLTPDGTPNPNVGRAYLEALDGDSGTLEDREMKTGRATLSYQFDLNRFKPVRNIGLGRYTASALFQKSDQLNRSQGWYWVNTTPLPGSSTDLSNIDNRIRRRFYLDPANGVSAAVPDDPTAINKAPGYRVERRQVKDVPRYNLQGTESKIAALQAFLWTVEPGYDRIVILEGFRRDDLTAQTRSYPSKYNAAGEWMPPPGNLAENAYYGTLDAMTKSSSNTATNSVIVRPIRAIGLYYNTSDILNASAPFANDFTGQRLQPSTGKTKDYGIKFDAMENLLSGTLTRYETVQKNQNTAGSGLRNAMLAPILNIWNTIGQENRVAQLGTPNYYQDTKANGYEFSLVANPSRAWRIRLTAGKQTIVVEDAAQDVKALIDSSLPEWQKFSNVTLTSGNATGYTTVADAIALAQLQLANTRSQIGKQSVGIRDWRYVGTATYAFTEGWLKSFRIGGNVRYETPYVTGFARSQPYTAASVLDIGKPFLSKSLSKYDLNAGYTTKILKNRVTWDIQLNIYNVLNDTYLTTREAVDDGTGKPYVTRRLFNQEPRSYQLTSSFSF